MAAVVEGGHKSADSCIIGEVESGNDGAGVCWQIVEGCDPFLMAVCGSVRGGKTLWEQNVLPWEHSAENQWKRGEADRKPHSVRWEGDRPRQKA